MASGSRAVFDGLFASHEDLARWCRGAPQDGRGRSGRDRWCAVCIAPQQEAYMATQKQDEKQGNGGRGQQGLTVQRGRQLSREQFPTASRITRTRPLAMMRRMLDDLDDFGTFGFASPFSTMRRMFDSMERMFDTDLIGAPDLTDRDVVWMPRIEITQRQDKLVLRADLPGVPQDQIQIYTEEGSLVIEGERALPREDQEDVWCSECTRGRFRRVIDLPDGADPDKASARYENGVLEVSVPMPAAQTRGRRIEIQGGAKQAGQPNSQLKEGGAQPEARPH
jgi:HSP20 family molecular chaperone IbpA